MCKEVVGFVLFLMESGILLLTEYILIPGKILVPGYLASKTTLYFTESGTLMVPGKFLVPGNS